MAKLLELDRLDKPGFYYTATIKRVIYELHWDEDTSLEDKSKERNLIPKFRVIRRGSRLVLFLIEPIAGPRQLVVEIDVVDRTRKWLGVAERYSVHVFVSKYDQIKFV